MVRMGVLGLVVMLLLPPSRAVAEEVVETRADGSVSLRYQVDDQGRKHGRLIAFHANGEKAREAYYKADVLHGVERAWTEAGVLRHAHTYAKGTLSGAHKTYDDRGRLVRQQTYRGGVLHGSYKRFHPNKRLAVVATYRKGRLHGKYVEKAPDGSVRIKTTYADGALHGTYEVFDGKRKITKQSWERGAPLLVDGVVPFPRPKATIARELTRLIAPGGVLPNDALEADRVLALRELKAYRYLVGVPYDDLELDAEYNRLAQAGSEICAAIKRITHTPPNPGWPAARFEPAFRGAKNSNLHQGRRACRSVRGYMDDSDPSNIGEVGHRCWCINPAMRKTGFGHERGFTAMWALDDSRTSVPDYAFVALPPPGYVPAPWMAAHWAWSVSLNPKRFAAPRAGGVRPRIERVGEDFLPTGEALEIEALSVHTKSVGIPYLVIFRPKDLSMDVGARYRVTLEGVTPKGGKSPLVYFVEWFDHPYQIPRLPKALRGS